MRSSVRVRVWVSVGMLVLATSSCKDSTGPTDGGGGRTAVYAAGGGLSLLYRVPLQANATDSVIGAITTAAGVNLSITDLALDRSGGLWGITFTDLYRINSGSGIASKVGALGVQDMNALTFAPDGRLLGAGAAGDLSVIDTLTGQASVIGSYGSVQLSGGDLAYGPDGRLFATVIGPPGFDRLVVVDPATGVATPAGTATSIGFANVWGLVFVGDQLYGLSYGATLNGTVGVLLRIDPVTGLGTQVRMLGFRTYGAARIPRPHPDSRVVSGSGATSEPTNR
jgi:hypothetical protein